VKATFQTNSKELLAMGHEIGGAAKCKLPREQPPLERE